ncbi:Protein kinase [Rhodococcus sp. AW25M09]|nr:Protein kinase [Rhodococcus sp. AW25M09]
MIIGGNGGGIDWLASEWSRELQLVDVELGETLREGIPVSQWRSLPDSPTAEPDKLQQ